MRVPDRRWLIILGGALVALAGIVLWLVSRPDPPRARQYRDVNACLLTDDQGVTGAAGGAVWAGMQEASLATRARVQYLAVRGPQTSANASSFLASLAQGRCSVVFVAGEAPVGAVRLGAGRFPQVRFVVVAGGASERGNVTVIAESSTEQITQEVRRIMASEVGDGSNR